MLPLRDNLAQYSLTLLSRQDMRSILRYIAHDKISAAQKMRRLLAQAFGTLAENPHIGSKRAEITQKSVRFWTVESYQIVYSPETQPLEILRILSSYRDISKILE